MSDGRLCWICRERRADSREHKFKASDLRRFFGGGRWNGEIAPVHGREGPPVSIQGPRSDRMVFAAVLCQRCNNEATQPCDRAYDTFIERMLGNREQVLRERQLDFAMVFDDGWETAQLNLFRYFAKHLGCKIAGVNGHEVPGDLRDVILQAPFRTALRVTFHVHEDLLLGPHLDEGLWLGPLGHFSADDSGVPTYWSSLTVGWLMVGLWYYCPVPEDATPWIASKRALRIGAYSALTEEQREEVRRRGAGLPCRPLFDGEG